jgi:DHA1 family bicyclomycin/chloramphenicol resistance-like MFS transporter
MLLYTAAGLACALAVSPAMLLVSRFAQGVGAAGGSVLAFAIIRDLFEGQAARTKLSSISMVFSLAPVIAPALGGFVLLLGGWRTIYLVLMLAGLVLTATAWLRLAETRKRGPGGGGYRLVLRERRTVGYALVASFNIGAVLAFVTGSPMVLQGAMGLSPQQFGMVFALIASGVVTGAWVNGRLVARTVTPAWAIGFALVATLVAGCAMSALAWVGHLSLVEMTPLLFLATFSRGLLSPNTIHAALEPVPQAAGAASALIGSLQMLMGALSGICVGLLFPALGPAAMSVVMAGFSLAALMAWRVTEYE